MTGTSSARPADLQAYPGALDAMDEALDRLANDLDDGLEAFKSGAGELAGDFDATGPGTWVRDLAAEPRHLGAWVLSVGDAFEQAGGTGVVEMDATPQPGEYAESLSDLFEHGDPVEHLDDKARDEANDYDEGDHWGARPR